MPTEPETYVHRIGRTGRAGASGKAMVFVDSDEKKHLNDIIKLIKQDIPVVKGHPYESKGRPHTEPKDKKKTFSPHPRPQRYGDQQRKTGGNRRTG